jgi:anti-anti-sigma factor
VRPDPSFVVTQRSKDTWVLAGELDMATCPILDRSMDLATFAGRVLVLDVSELTFVDSTGIHALVRILDAVGPGCLVLRGTRPNVRDVIEVVGLTMFRNLRIAS